jgi:outer membrane protein OmpA-like peptidoglycan-associated protein
MKTTELGDISLIARATGYLEFEAVITASELEAQDLIVIPMKALEVGATINLENVLFYQGTANFIEGSEKELDRVVDMLVQNQGMRILIKGHTDNVGNPALNLELSRERVRVVMEYLASKGIDAARLEGKGFGGTEPIADNDSEENRRLNRRVEFTILEN